MADTLAGVIVGRALGQRRDCCGGACAGGGSAREAAGQGHGADWNEYRRVVSACLDGVGARWTLDRGERDFRSRRCWLWAVLWSSFGGYRRHAVRPDRDQGLEDISEVMANAHLLRLDVGFLFCIWFDRFCRRAVRPGGDARA